MCNVLYFYDKMFLA